MKLLNLIILLSAFLCTQNLKAAIWRVNNIAGMSADFTTLTAAHTGAVAGDTLYIEPSATSYGNLTITKQLVIIGAGYFQAQNYPTYPTNGLSIVGTLALNTGSSGSIIYGLGGGLLSLNAANLIISRNHDMRITIGVSSNISIISNYRLEIIAGSVASNILISNNHIININTNSNLQAVFQNNILEIVGASYSLVSMNSQVVRNNILLLSESGSSFFTLTNCTVSNNIDAQLGQTRFGTISSNFGNVAVTNIFVGSSGTSTDGQWKLKLGSPAIGAGLGGIDCGMYGGDSPYVLSGIAPGPAVTKFNTSGQGSNSTPLQVSISVESKN